MIRVALIGCGDVASVHFDAIADNPRAELVAVCDTDPVTLAQAAHQHDVPGFAHHLTMLEQVAPDVVHICTPHAEHAAVAVDVLRAGVHVLLEKPLAHDLTGGRAIVDAAAASDARIGICFQNRYNPTSSAMRKFLDSGAFGAIVGARAQVMWTRTADYYLTKPWRGTWAGSGGGLLMNQAIHTIDLVQWLIGDIDHAAGSTSALMFGDVIEVEDTATAVFHHANGVRTNFYATLTHFTSAPVLIEITCEGGVLRLEGNLKAIHPDGTVQVLADADVVRTARSYWGASHERLINDFYARLDEPGAFWIDPVEAYKSLAVIQSIYGKGALS